MGDTRTDPGQYYPGGKVVSQHGVAPPQIVVQWSDVQGKPQIAPLPDRYRDGDMKGKINEIASKFATVVLAALVGWTAVADITVQKKRKDQIYNDDQVVVDVTGSGVEVDTNAVREIVRPMIGDATNAVEEQISTLSSSVSSLQSSKLSSHGDTATRSIDDVDGVAYTFDGGESYEEDELSGGRGAKLTLGGGGDSYYVNGGDGAVLEINGGGDAEMEGGKGATLTLGGGGEGNGGGEGAVLTIGGGGLSYAAEGKHGAKLILKGGGDTINHESLAPGPPARIELEGEGGNTSKLIIEHTSNENETLTQRIARDTVGKRDLTDNKCYVNVFSAWVLTGSDAPSGDYEAFFRNAHLVIAVGGADYAISRDTVSEDAVLVDDFRVPDGPRFLTITATRSRVAFTNETFVTQSFVTNAVKTLAPATGNYAAVSNAAMSAISQVTNADANLIYTITSDGAEPRFYFTPVGAINPED